MKCDARVHFNSVMGINALTTYFRIFLPLFTLCPKIWPRILSAIYVCVGSLVILKAYKITFIPSCHEHVHTVILHFFTSFASWCLFHHNPLTFFFVIKAMLFFRKLIQQSIIFAPKSKCAVDANIEEYRFRSSFFFIHDEFEEKETEGCEMVEELGYSRCPFQWLSFLKSLHSLGLVRCDYTHPDHTFTLISCVRYSVDCFLAFK